MVQAEFSAVRAGINRAWVNLKRRFGQASVASMRRKLRRRGQFGAVCEAFWNRSRGYKTSLRGCRSEKYFLYPIFVSDGYFSERAIPEALGFQRTKEGELLRVQTEEASNTYLLQGHRLA